MKKIISPIKLSLAALLSMAAIGQAQTTDTWNGNGSDANWSTAGNWSPGAPNPGDSLIFSASPQSSPFNDTAANTGYGGITFDATAGSFDLLGNDLNFGGLIVNHSTVLQSIDLNLALTNATTITTASGDISIGLNAGGISGTGALTVNGPGTLTVSNKTYSGGTTVNSGATMIAENDNGSYTLAGGSLELTYGSWWSTAAYTFTADSSLGVIAGGPVYNSSGRFDCVGTVGSPGFKWTVIGTGRFQMNGGSNHILADSVEVTAPAVLSDVNAGNLTISGLGTCVITVDNGAALRKNNGGIVQNPIVLNGGAGPDNLGVLVANQEAYSGQPNTIAATFTSNITFVADCTLGAQYGSMVISGNISGPGGLTLIGGYPLLLSGSNNFAGSITINAGTLQVGSSNALQTANYMALNGSSVLDLNGNAASVGSVFFDDGSGLGTVDNSASSAASLSLSSGYFTGAVKNSGGGPLSIINVSGSTTLMGANSYTGSNVVRAGSLGINIPAGTTTGGLVLVADNATLTLYKTTPGSSLKAAGATFGTSTSGATTLNLDLANYGNPSAPIINATNGTGVLSVNGTLTLNFNNPANMSAGQFPIIKYTSLTGTGALAFNPIPGITAQLVTNTANKSIDLKITGAPITTWNGSVTNNLWDIQTTTNWTYSGSPVQYSDGSAVYFDDTAPTNNVNLTTALTPGSVLVNTANTYTFGGSGPLYGGTVTKNGSGTLIMDVSGNGYSSTTIAGGTLQVGNNDGLGDLGSGNVDDEGTLVFNQNIALTVAGVISGAGQVVQNDTNIVTLSSANTYTGGTAVNAGVLKMGNAAALGAPGPGTALATIASGSTLDIGGQNIVVTNTIIVHGTGFSATQGQVMSSGGTCIGCGNVGINDLQLLGDATIGGSSGDWTIGANGLGICGNNHVLTKIGSSTVYLQATAVTSPSMVVIAQGGILQFSYPGFGTSVVVLTNNSSVDTWDAAHWTGITSANSFIVANNGGQINNTHGAWYGQADKDVYNGSVTLNGNLTINCTSTYNGMPNGQTYGQQTFNGAVSGVGGITATIATGDTVSFTRANTYSGATIVTGGAYGGTLKLSAIQQGGGAYTNNDGAILDVPRQTGYATVPMSSLALGSTNGSTLSLTRQTALTATAPITATNLTLTGINAVTLPGSAFAVSGQYPLIKYGTLTGGGSLMVGGAVRGVPGYISNNVANSSIDLVVPGGTPVVWTGSSSAIWDIAATLNWQTNSVATDYEQAGSVGDAVTFNDSSSVTNVNISASVSPALIIVNNTNKNYTLTGAIITGNTSLLKQGPGSLLLTNGANTFTGGATINGGTVQLGNAGSLNNASGSVTVTGNGALDFNNQQPTVLACTISGAGLKGLGTLVQNSGANNTYGPGSITLAGSATIGGTNRWDLRNGANTFNTPTNAYTLTKVGAGYTAFSGTAMSTNLGDIYILGGTLGYQAGTTGLGNPTNTIYIGSGGSLEFYSASVPLNKFIVMSNTASLVPDNGAGTSGTTPATVNIISGPIYLAGGNANLNCNYYNGCALSNTISGPGGLTTGYNGYNRFYAPNTYVGDTTVQGGIYLFANSCIVSTNNIYINVGPLFVTNNAYVGVSSTYLNVNLGGLILGQNGSANFATMQIGGSGYVDASGRTDGTFTLPNHSLLRPYNGGYVKGNLVVTTGSTLTPGGSGSVQTNITCYNNVVFQAGSTNYADVSKTATATNCDTLYVGGQVTYAGTLRIQTNGTVAYGVGDQFKLFIVTNGCTGNFDSIVDSSGITWSFTPATGVATILTVPPTVNTNAATANFKATVASGALNFTWAQDHMGWQLYTNAVGLTATGNWFPVAGSATVTNETININPANSNVFFQLRYP